MLDECRGDRLEEVLAVFSSAVLKKLVAERALNSGHEYRPTISEKISLENWGYSGDRTELNALMLAHKVSLTSLLSKKNVARTKYHEFEEVLATKERGLVQRKEQAKLAAEKPEAKASEKSKAEVHRIIRTNWTGNDEWTNSLLLNDTHLGKDGLLASNFDDVWAGVQEGPISNLADQNTGLLEQLDNRVRMQRARLEKWDDFRKKMFGNMPLQPIKEVKEKTKPKAVDLGFTAHLKLGLDQVKTRDRMPLDTPPPQYAKLLDGMKAELEAIGKPSIPDFSSLLGSPRRSSFIDSISHPAQPEPTADPISDISEWEDDKDEQPHPMEIPTKPSVERRYRLAPPKSSLEAKGRVPKLSVTAPAYDRNGETNRIQSPIVDSPEDISTSPSLVSSGFSSTRRGSTELNVDPPPSASISHHVTADLLSSKLSHSDERTELMPPPPTPHSVSPTQAMADEILASMTNASPSPMKKHRHTLSLAERTRMSMTRTISYDNDDEDLSNMSPIKITKTRDTTSPTENIMPEKEEYEDLVARTRRSMAGFEAARQKAQLERKRSERKSKTTQRKDSYFPKLEEEDFNDTSIAEELIEAGEEDYEAVFKSRPRIQTSPLPSPNKTWGQ